MRVKMDSPRIVSALVAGAIELAAILALIAGLSPDLRRQVTETLTAVNLDAPKPPPSPTPPPPSRQVSHAASGKAAPANIRSKASPVLAAPVVIPLPRPVVAATIPNQGSQNQSGASTLPGIGTGAGGQGNGNGSGDSGDGEGAGGSEIEWTGGRIKDSDYPRVARDAHAQGTTSTEITVGIDGRPRACQVVGSSGNAELDATTCRLIMQRFRYRPATDRSGRPVVGTVEFDEEWVLQPDRRD